MDSKLNPKSRVPIYLYFMKIFTSLLITYLTTKKQRSIISRKMTTPNCNKNYDIFKMHQINTQDIYFQKYIIGCSQHYIYLIDKT